MPKFRRAGQGFEARYRGHRFTILPNESLIEGAPVNRWLLWHSRPAHPRNELGWPVWPVRFAGPFGCTGIFKSLDDAKRAVLAICAALAAPGSNVIEGVMSRHRRFEDPREAVYEILRSAARKAALRSESGPCSGDALVDAVVEMADEENRKRRAIARAGGAKIIPFPGRRAI